MSNEMKSKGPSPRHQANDRIIHRELDPSQVQDEDYPAPRGKGWTLGNSSTLVPGTPAESRWVSLAWVVVPSTLAILILLAMVGAGG